MFLSCKFARQLQFLTLNLKYTAALLGQVYQLPGQLIVSSYIRIPGKTLLAKTLARVLDVPFSVSDATSFTQVSQRQFATGF